MAECSRKGYNNAIPKKSKIDYQYVTVTLCFGGVLKDVFVIFLDQECSNLKQKNWSQVCVKTCLLDKLNYRKGPNVKQNRAMS